MIDISKDTQAIKHGIVLKWLIVLLCLSSHSAAQQVLFEENERFHPVVERNAMVASQQAIASRVGRDILKQGGNAVDAAVAVAYALTVTLPRGCGLGGGGFMMIWLHDKQKAIAIDYRETAPSAATANMYLDDNGQVVRDKITDSVLSSGVPGTVAGLNLALRKYGTMSLRQVMQPAILLAEKGFKVTPGLERALHMNEKRLIKSEATRRLFFKRHLQPYKIGDRFRQPDLARTLRLIAKQGDKGFYQGTVAKRLVNYVQQHQGIITLQDLKHYRANIVKPLQSDFHGYKIIAMPPPSSGGITTIQILNIIESLPLTTYGLNSAQSIHYLAEAMNLAYHDRNSLLGDPAFVDIPLKKLMSKDYAKQLLKRINPRKHTPPHIIDQSQIAKHESRQTTHFSVADQAGNMVANTFTLNYSYGSGLVVPGTGILLNNEMDDFTAKPGEANAFGLVQGDKNRIEPGKRPLSSMAPIIVLNPQGQAWLASGTPGGSRIITTMVQFLLNVIVHHLNIATATSIPRMHSQLWPDTIFVEQGVSIDTIRLLESMGHRVTPVAVMGSIQTVMKAKRHTLGYSDPRRAGALAIGY